LSGTSPLTSSLYPTRQAATVCAAPQLTGPVAAGILFAVSLPLLLSLRISPLPGQEGAERSGTAWHDLADGLRHIRRHPLLGPLMLVVAVSELGFVGPLNLGMIMLARERDWGASGMGWVIAAFGVGAGASALLLAVRGRVPRAGLVMCLTVLLGAVAIGSLAYVPSVALAVAVACCVGLFAGLGGSLLGALVQTVTEPAYLGRVTSVSTLFTHAIAPLSYPVTGAAVAMWGTGPVFVASAAVCALGAVTGLAIAGLRRAELPG
ncbi:MFS transporter, partial [Streptomyces sp. NPDC001948]